MLLRRFAPVAAAALALACEPSVPHATNPTAVDYAAFDVTSATPDIPLPNDLALQPSAIQTQNPAQQELLKTFVNPDGSIIGFPNDQEVPITVDFVRETLSTTDGSVTRSSPPLDVTSIKIGPGGNLVVLGILASGFGPVAIDTPAATDYATNGDHGTLTIHKKPNAAGSRRWDPGTYIVAVRGGASGIKTSDTVAGGLIYPQPTTFLLLQGQPLTRPENQTLLPGNNAAEKAAAAAQLEKLRVGYLPALAAIDSAFPHLETAVLSTFHIAPITTHVEFDAGAGLVPLPSDFLLGADGHLLPALANPAGPFGALGPGLATLDGFSTTAMILSQTNAPVLASTINASTVFLFELDTNSKPPKATRLGELKELQTKAPRFVAEPPAITVVPPGSTTAVSTAIGLQPAVPVQLPAALGGAFVPLPPLKEGTEYAVVITDGVTDLNGQKLTRGTLSKIVLNSNPVSVGGKSQISGVTDAQSVGLEQMRQLLLGVVLPTLKAEKSAITPDHVAFAYTFRTQTFLSAATQLAALPYPAPAATALPVQGTTSAYCASAVNCAGTVASVFNRYAVDTPATVPSSSIGAIVESTIVTFNNLNSATGAFNDPTKVAPTLEPIPVIIAVPGPGSFAGGCIPAPGIPCGMPLVIFRHGLNGSRASMLAVANELNAAGLAVAAIDANKHGARSFCSADKDCVAGASCVPIPALANQGDPAGATPGKCQGGTPINGSLFLNKITVCPAAGCPNAVANAGTPAASGNFLLSANLFRTRDTLRQDLIDQSQLIRVLALDPTKADSANSDIFKTIAGAVGGVIDPRSIYYVGESLGSIQGDANVATNPRISKAVFNVGGQTIVDVFSNAPALAPDLNALLAGLGIQPGTAKYLAFINTAKWILDPADPANFSDHLLRNNLPNLLPPVGGNTDGSVPQLAKKILGQLANCDTTVPNPFNLLMYKSIGLGPDGANASTGTQEVFRFQQLDSTACPGGPIPHGFFTNWGTGTPPPGVPPGLWSTGVAQMTKQAQDDAAAFLLSDLHPSLNQTPAF